jgi:hypothetical protein
MVSSAIRVVFPVPLAPITIWCERRRLAGVILPIRRPRSVPVVDVPVPGKKWWLSK